ncbi:MULTISPECIES: molybdenum cofactor biosynthesis protein MoaE [Thiorhodovibrio]|uniref:molybdenum cofactor biosynthesis protein MoaE n=1 Tax=Thiorhodovibrio TaxID=61593 RepID=UPI001912D34C|nr:MULTISPECIES: molybdenum cofactor biosynthesis protein MoaE [Thiorhodovibrio]WPL13296.1 Molybdopterin synthase catalytic subunit [Thiorhodovibrio litoralis]
MFEVRVQQQPLVPETEQRQLRRQQPGLGALVSFTGIMRDFSDGNPVSEMLLEHYPGMTDSVLRQLMDQARTRWPLRTGLIVHRVGRLHPEDPIVLVATGSMHRTEAFRACEFLIDALKTQAPLWKRETTQQGPRWVAAREHDTQAADRWDTEHRDAENRDQAE